jgi:hypothetical protein
MIRAIFMKGVFLWSVVGLLQSLGHVRQPKGGGPAGVISPARWFLRR